MGTCFLMIDRFRYTEDQVLPVRYCGIPAIGVIEFEYYIIVKPAQPELSSNVSIESLLLVITRDSIERLLFAVQ